MTINFFLWQLITCSAKEFLSVTRKYFLHVVFDKTFFFIWQVIWTQICAKTAWNAAKILCESEHFMGAWLPVNIPPWRWWWCKVIFVSTQTFVVLGWFELWLSWDCENWQYAIFHYFSGTESRIDLKQGCKLTLDHCLKFYLRELTNKLNNLEVKFHFWLIILDKEIRIRYILVNFAKLSS